ncbi:hypothetical protein H4219_000446 [Mycoemilia scoparia]|uniref:protein disulfide-isomerase n=1 Tax=Mycoemilia scoparia TaxID=417184 RepID=A0A9W8A8F9_9FUNG|nr:hypothetical protein H4219_000446 [Mycoemilia scoparia]
MFGKKALSACIGIALTIASFVGASDAPNDAADLVVLNDKNFDKIIDGSKPALVKFYAPWCGHCQAMAEDYASLATAFAAHKDDVIIAKLDADEHRDLGTRFDIKGFPTIKWFPKGETKDPEDYNGGRDLDSFASFVKEKTGLTPHIKKPISYITELTYDKFDEVALDPEKYTLVEFYAPWCGHCKKLAPIYAKLSEVFANEPSVVIANYDASEDTKISEKVTVNGFPTIYMFPAGKDAKPIEFSAHDRSLETLVNFVNKHAGTKRSAQGTLDATAGRIAALDAIARKYVAATNKERKKLIERAKKVAQEFSDNTQVKFAKYYIKVMEKANDASDFITKESKRLLNIVSKSTLAPANLDNFSIRQNILNVFSGKASDVSENEKEKPAADEKKEEKVVDEKKGEHDEL